MSNPEMLQNMINNNPMLKNMTQNNPELEAALKDPATLSMLSDPQVISSALGMMNRMNTGNNTGTLEGGSGSFPFPGKYY